MKLKAYEKKIAVKSILRVMEVGRGDRDYWIASDFYGMTQSTKKTILKELDRLVSLGYVEKITDYWRPNSPVYRYVLTGKTGQETRDSNHWYCVLKVNILGGYEYVD